MELKKEIENINLQAIDFINSKQEVGGNFISNEGKPLTFYTGLIISSLENSTIQKAEKIKNKGVNFLISQKSTINSYNYWQRESSNYTEDPLPDDLDDTSIALLAIYQNNKKLINEHVLHDFISLLIKNENIPGGPYETWILPSHLPEWKDIDIVVNSNIANFLLRQDIQLQPLQDYFDSIILNGKYTSKYYYHEIIIIYFLSKVYSGNNKDLLIKKILSYKNNNHWENPLFTALSITSLLNLGVNALALKDSIHYLIKNNNSGKWNSCPFIIESISGSKITYSSCDAYISACCVEAFSLYQKNIDNLNISKNDIRHEKNINSTYKKSKGFFIKKYPYLTDQFNNIVYNLSTKDPVGEIPLLSFWFAEQLKNKGFISKPIIINLALLNVLGWIGYSIYDSILDGEDKIQFLPIATICTRQVVDITHQYIKKPLDYKIIDSILGDIAIATAWEYENCKLKNNSDYIELPEKLPSYKNFDYLAKKSLGHALGPIIICLLMNKRSEALLVKEFFINYLIARQLNDDAHDWLEDLQNGFLNSISANMLKDLPSKRISLKSDTLFLQEIFWDKEIDIASKLIINYCNKAKAVLKKITILSDVTFLENLLIPLENSARLSVEERDKTKSFLNLIEN